MADDDPLDRIAGRLARVGKPAEVPRPAPGIPGAALPPPRAKQSAFTGLPSALPSRPELTKVTAVAPPAKGSAPMPAEIPDLEATAESPPPPDPFRRRLESRPERQPSPPSTVAPWLSPEAQEAARRGVERMGGTVARAPESHVAPRSDPPPSLRASVKGIRAWARDNARVITWLVGLGTAGGGATALRDQITQALGLVTAADLAPLRSELAATKATLETVQRERAYEARELQRDLDAIRSEAKRRDESQDGQIERLRRRTLEPEGMRVTPSN